MTIAIHDLHDHGLVTQSGTSDGLGRSDGMPTILLNDIFLLLLLCDFSLAIER